MYESWTCSIATTSSSYEAEAIIWHTNPSNPPLEAKITQNVLNVAWLLGVKSRNKNDKKKTKQTINKSIHPIIFCRQKHHNNNNNNNMSH